MSREFGKTTDWIMEKFDNTEFLLQTGYNIYLNNEREKAKIESQRKNSDVKDNRYFYS